MIFLGSMLRGFIREVTVFVISVCVMAIIAIKTLPQDEAVFFVFLVLSIIGLASGLIMFLRTGNSEGGVVKYTIFFVPVLLLGIYLGLLRYNYELNKQRADCLARAPELAASILNIGISTDPKLASFQAENYCYQQYGYPEK